MSATSYNTKKKKPPSLFSQLQDHHYTACGDLSVSAESLSRKVGASGRRGPRSSQGRGRGNENRRGSNQGGSLGRGATRGRGATTGWGTTGGQSATGGQGASAGRSVTSRRGATSGRDAHSGWGATSGRGTHSGRVIERGNLDNGSARESSHPVRDALGRTNGSRGRGGTGHNNDGRGAGRNLRHQGATNGQPSNGSQNSFGSGVGRSDAEDGPNRYKRKIYCKLSDWLDKPADVTVLEVNKDDQAILQKFLSDALSSDKNMCVFVEILSTACKSFSCQQGILDIFSAVFTEKFVKKLSKCQLTYSSLKNGELKRFLKHQHLLLSRYFQAMPMRALDTIPELLKTIHEHLDALQERELIQQDVAEELELYKKLLERFSAQMEARTKRTEKAKLNNDMIVEFAALSVQDPEEDFRMVPIEPSYDDIFASNEPSLRQNIVEGKFADVSTYLDVQFRLLREDFIRPLREGINNFANNTLTKNQNITICKGMKVIKAEIDRGKLIYSVQLQTKKKLNLENSKKFMTGNLVCVTEDNFASFTLAVIADTKLDALKLGIISLTPLNDGKLNFTTLYTLVESPAFFVAYKHVLAALQRMDQDCFPLAEHIVHVQARVDPPCYLEARPNPRYDLTVVLDVSYMKDTSTNSIFGKALSKSPPETSLSNVRVTSGMECWPSNEDFGLDESQLQALHAALTSRLAIIQGPPGTGKTYLGLKIVQCLLHNSATWTNDEKSSRKSTKFGSKPPAQPPILVICFKNHSLDQFLERMLKFTSKIVRIGGRGENEAIEKLKVTEILQRLKTEKKSPSYLSQAGASLYRKLNDITKRYKEMQTRIMKISQKNGLLRWEVLKSHNIVAPHVAEQFSNVSYRDWILPNDEDMQQSAPSTPLLSIWENDAISTTEELLSNEEAEECEELWLDALETTRVEEHQRFLDDDASTIFDGEIADEVERSDGDFELLTEDLIQELEDTVASEHAPALTKRRLQLENQLECLKRLSAFTKVDVSALELFGDQNVHQLCFQDRCLLYATWRHNLRTKYQKEVTMRETKIQRLGEQGSMNSAMFGALTWEIRRYQSSLAGLATLEGVISWDCLIYNGIIPPYTLKQLSIHLYLLWLLPCDPEFSTVPITKPMWTIWKSCKEGSCITDKKDDVLWRARMERARYEVPVTDSDPLDPHFFDIRSNDQEFEVLVENYDQKLTEMEFMVNQNLTREDYELHSASLRREQECLKRVSMIATKNVTNLKLKDDVDVQTLSFVDRCLLYATWKQKLISEYEKKSRVYEKMTPQLTAEMEEIKLARYLYVARQAHVVGLTTTGAATYQALIEDLHPKIVIVEEAAEVLEGHVVASLTKSCEHLIMIGDHQQLRPSTAVYELAIKYGLETSLFERMINNGLEYQTLQHQHRMRPEISCLLVPTIYPTLKDASSVEGRDEIRGLTSSVFFVSHGQLERQGTDENMSRSNVHEADFIVELASHLVLQGYLPDEITVLTPYSGQALLLKKILRCRIVC